MTARKRTWMVKVNTRRLYLEAWEKEKTQGTSLAAFCRTAQSNPCLG